MADFGERGTTDKTAQTLIHLRSGGVVEGQVWPATDDEIAQIKSVMGDLLRASGGWQVNVETDAGWVIVPGSSVDFIEVLIGRSQDHNQEEES